MCLPRAAGAQKVTTQDQRGGANRGAIGIPVSELHEIWQVEGKRHSDRESCIMNVAKI